jgi:hypothetical protein
VAEICCLSLTAAPQRLLAAAATAAVRHTLKLRGRNKIAMATLHPGRCHTPEKNINRWVFTDGKT